MQENSPMFQIPRPRRSTTVSQWLLALLCAATGMTVQADTSQPTFDCARVKGDIEMLICQDPGLAALDHKMAEVFKRAAARNTGADLKALTASQRGWIKGRNECWKAQDKTQCVTESYNVRMVELQITNALVEVPTAIGFVCNGDESVPFFATFYNELDPPAAVITYGDDQAIAIAAPAASGSRYTAESMEYWEHQGKANVNWYGTRLTCIPRK
jgi:uncharacterized protein